MRADIVAGTVFPDYELTDHTGERRKLSDLSGARSHDPGAQSRADTARRIGARTRVWSDFTTRWKSARSSTSASTERRSVGGTAVRQDCLSNKV